MSCYPEPLLNHRFGNQALLQEALTHPSYLNETRQEGAADYQRLEFLGDAVLGLLLADLLYQQFPTLPEGDLSRLRSSLVDQPRLAGLAADAGIAPLILMGKGAEREGGRTNPSILADVFEALIGAIYYDAGFVAVQQVVTQIYTPLVAAMGATVAAQHDAKSELQELLAARKQPIPVYNLVAQQGPDHDRLFSVEVVVDGVVLGQGQGRSKKAAQQSAAEAALARLQS
ncbi:MAG: ribonuclease III [Geobacter sp.]|nr:ribonuclease III [Geobacter sp.]